MTTAPLAAIVATAITLPGGPPVGMDYLAYDPANDRVWVPAGNTGKVDVIDAVTRQVRSIDGLATAPSGRPGRPPMGPSSATVGDGVVWVGNRADQHLYAFDARTLVARGSVPLPSMPDGLAYIPSTHELWVTTPRDGTITVAKLGEPATPGPLATIKLDGEPEGYAVDDGRGLFYTNLEDKDRTLAIAVKTRRVVASWPSHCGMEGPRGLAIDPVHQWLFVACTNGAVVLDLAHAHAGQPLGRITTGGGVDNLAYDATRRALFVASGHDGNLIVARIDPRGAPQKVVTVPTAKGARNPVLDARGRAYVEDAANGRLLIVEPTAD